MPPAPPLTKAAALFISSVGAPQRASTTRASASMAAKSATSTISARTLSAPIAWPISARSAASFCGSTSTIATFMPAAAARRTAARPIPLAPPVMTATPSAC